MVNPSQNIINLNPSRNQTQKFIKIYKNFHLYKAFLAFSFLPPTFCTVQLTNSLTNKPKMPSLKTSSIFLFCLSHQAPEKSRLWDCLLCIKLITHPRLKILFLCSMDSHVTPCCSWPPSSWLLKSNLSMIALCLLITKKKMMNGSNTVLSGWGGIALFLQASIFF